jgi:hypothetical protein
MTWAISSCSLNWTSGRFDKEDYNIEYFYPTTFPLSFSHFSQLILTLSKDLLKCTPSVLPNYSDIERIVTSPSFWIWIELNKVDLADPKYVIYKHTGFLMSSLLTIWRTCHSLFTVLFIFRSRYLFAIGLWAIFFLLALDEIYHPCQFLCCTPKQHDSKNQCHTFLSQYLTITRDCHPLWCPFPWDFNQNQIEELEGTDSKDYNSLSELPKRDFQSELFPVQSPLLGES